MEIHPRKRPAAAAAIVDFERFIAKDASRDSHHQPFGSPGLSMPDPALSLFERRRNSRVFKAIPVFPAGAIEARSPVWRRIFVQAEF
jgi:hypothetical protein